MELTRTRAQLVNEALSKLQVVGSGQSPEAEDSDLVDGKVDALILQLAADGIANIPTNDEFPAEWFDCIAGLLANLCAPDFGKAFDPNVKAAYEAMLKRTNAARPTFETLAVEYF